MSGKGKPKTAPKRRKKGTGSVYYSKERGCWMGKAPNGRYPGGKTKYKWFLGPTKADVEKQMEAFNPSRGEDMKVGAWLNLWLKQMRVKPGTRRNRESAVKFHLVPSLGHINLRDLTPRQVEVAASGWRNRWKKPRGRVKKRASRLLNPTSARNVISILGTALRAAVRDRRRDDNPVASAYKPKGAKKKIDPFTADEIRTIARAAAKQPNTRAFALLAGTGMRVGEALALDCTDFDSATGALSITKTLDTTDRHLLGTPKSENSVRTIRVPTLPHGCMESLRAAIGTRKSGPVFRTATGQRTVYSVAYKAWAAFLKRLGIRYRGFHQMRHACASHMLAMNVDVAEVARYLGDTPAEILKTYAHATRTCDPAAALERFHQGIERQ